MLLFLLIFCYVFGFTGFTGFYVRAKNSEWLDGYYDNLLCNVVTMNQCEVFHTVVPLWLPYIGVINFTNLGTWMFLALGLRSRLLRHWRRLIGHVLRGEFHMLQHLSLKTEQIVIVGTTQKVVKRASSPS